MRITLAVAVACLTFGGLAAAGDATAAIRKSTDIPAQGLGPALTKLAKEFDFQVLYRTEIVSNLKSQPAVGALTSDEALSKVLTGTGLTYKYLDDKTVTIVPASTGSAESTSVNGKGSSGDADASKEGGKKTSQNFRVAQVDQGSNSQSTSVVNKNSTSQENAKSPSAGLEEIVVTAQKRAERLQDVPISISVLTGKELDTSTAQGLTDILNRVPGVVTSTYSVQGGGTTVAIRGVTAGGPVFNGPSPVAYYLDSVPFGLVKSGIAPDADAYDLDRVEVLRGPQGTLYGASAENGVVRVLSKDADLNTFDFKARASAFATDEGGSGSYRSDVAVNMPIVPGVLSARATIGYQELGGWIDKPGDENANDGHISTIRLKVNAQPTDALSVGLSAWRSRADYGAPNLGDRNNFSNNPGDESNFTNYDTYGLKVGYDFSFMTLSSSTGYLDYANQSNLDATASGATGIALTTRFDSRVVSEELIASSTHTTAWRWSLGGMYRDGNEHLRTAIPPIIPILGGALNETDTSKSSAVFGELTRLLLDGRLELTGGLRYFHDDVAMDSVVPTVTSDNKYDAVTPRAVVTWHPKDYLTTYASYSQGFRSGYDQYGAVRLSNPDIPSVKPDRLNNYEIGAKASLYDGRLQLDTAVYYIKWNDVQQTIALGVGANQITTGINGKSASGTGVDFGVAVQPLHGLDFGASMSWNSLSMDADVYSGGIVLFDKGDRLNLSAEWTASAFGSYAFPFGMAGLEGQFSASLNYTSEQDFRTLGSNATGAVRTIGDGNPMLLARSSFSVRSQHWLTTIFVDNLTNDRGSPVRTPFLPQPDYDLNVRPRSYGVQVEYKF